MGFRGVKDVQLEFVVVRQVPGSAVDLTMATGDFVVLFDATTGGYDPKDVRRVVAPLLSGEADVVVGREAGAVVSLHERVAKSLLGRVASWLFRTSFGGDQTGLRAFRREALGLPARALRVVEVPVSHQESAVPP
jgi:hypothetical protein